MTAVCLKSTDILYNFDPAAYNYDAYILTRCSPTESSSPATIRSSRAKESALPLSPAASGGCASLGFGLESRRFNNKLVVRAGWGMYYDRGELFTYLSPGFAAGVVTGGPFGVNQAPPFVSARNAPHLRSINITFRRAIPAPTGSPIHGERHWALHQPVILLRLIITCRIPEFRELALPLASSKGNRSSPSAFTTAEQAPLHHEPDSGRSMAAAQTTSP